MEKVNRKACVKCGFSSTQKELTIKEVAKRGGDAVKKKYGKKYFTELVKRRWKK